MALPDRRTTDVLLTILLFAIGLGIIYAARSVIVIFAFSILFAYLIDRSFGSCSVIHYSSKTCEVRTFWRRISR
jgi:uncharacterized membrane protein